MKDDSLNKLAVKSGIFFVVCQMLIRGISFATTPIYTRLLSTEQFGQIRVYESWLQIAVPIMSLCLWRSVERAKYDMREKFDSYTSAVQNLSYISIALMTGMEVQNVIHNLISMELKGIIHSVGKNQYVLSI